jgi:serine/threonine protein kinase
MVSVLQPAMDVYSLGVLLFIMLVGKKPWDAQRNHTLAYAVQCTCEAPGLSDGVFVGLSAPAKQLLMWMLHEDPSRRPSAQQVLKHNWLQQGGVCKVCMVCSWV